MRNLRNRNFFFKYFKSSTDSSFMLLKSLGFVSALTLTSQAALLVNVDTTYTENFNGLATSVGNTTAPATTWTDNSTLPNWYSSESQITTGNGSATGAGLYNLGTDGSGNRALGTVGGTVIFGVQMQNNSGGNITSLDVSYVGQTWRVGAAVNRLTFEYFIGDAGTVDSEIAGWVPVSALNYNSGTAFSESTLSANIENLNIANGQNFWFRWSDSASPGQDATLGIDNMSLTAVPETSFYSLAAVGFLGLVIVGREYRARVARRNAASVS